MPKIQKFTGLNTVKRPDECGPGDLQVARNVLVSDEGALERRQAGVPAWVGTAPHSLFAASVGMYYVDDTTLWFYDGSSQTTVHTGLESSLPMHYLELNGQVYYANGVDSGVAIQTVRRSWGLEPPPAPRLSAATGDLVPGAFQVALTYVRTDGQESGTSRVVAVEAPEGGVAVSGIQASADPDVVGIALYLTASGGEALEGRGLYRQGILPNVSASLTIRGAPAAGGTSCQTFNLTRPPASGPLAYYRGRVYLVSGDYLVHTEPWMYELVSPDFGYVPLGARGKMVIAVENGLWVGTTREFMFLSGKDPLSEGGFQVRSRVPVPVTGVAHLVNSVDLPFKAAAPGLAAVWVAADGVYAGDANGLYVNLTGSRWAPGTSDGVFSFVDTSTGKAQLVFGLRGGAGTGSVGVAVQ